MSIQLPPDLERDIRSKVESGQFPDAAEVVREALRLLDEHERQLATLRAKLQSGLDQIARGEVVPYTPELMAKLRREADERFERGEQPNPDVCPD